MITAVGGDVRLALRALRRRPGFTFVALATLALGIGANTAFFSVVSALLLRPLPFGPRSERLVTLHGAHPTQARDWEDSGVSPADLLDVRRESATLEDVAAAGYRSFSLEGEGGAERVLGASVTPNLFPMLGIAPARGRYFRADEGQDRGFEAVVLVSHGLWQRRFGGDESIVGRSLRLNGRELTVVGVMPEGFKFPHRQDLWVPLRLDPRQRAQRGLSAYALLRTEAPLDETRHELLGLAQRLAAQYPETNRDWSLHAFAIRDTFVDEGARVGTTTLLAAVAFVLLIGCANLANLLLARGVARQREMALRSALGAGRGALLRQSLVESLLLSLGGGVLGLLLAPLALDALFAAWPEEVPFWIRVETDWRVLAFTAALSVLTALLVGLVPALRISRPDLVAELNGTGRGSSPTPGQGRLQAALVAGQIALCLALLVGANLMIRTFLELQEADAGFDGGHLLTLRMTLAGDAYDPPEAKAAFYERAAERLLALPGVRAAASTSSIPTDDGGGPGRVVPEGRPLVPEEEIGVSLVVASRHFFEALGTPLLEGRTFTAGEVRDPRATAVVVNQGLARRFWPDGGALGRSLSLVGPGTNTTLVIVGIAPDVQFEEFGEETPQSRLNVYLPLARAGRRGMALLVRTERDPALVAGAARRALHELDPGSPVYDVRTMSEVRAFTTWEQRFLGKAMGYFACAALLLACLGVYGVLAHAVSRRTREIGIRMALGAKPKDVVRLVVRQGATLVAAGAGAGLLLSLGLTRLLRGVLYGVSASDPAAFVGMAALLAGVVLLASYLPARRGARTDPIAALRSD
jgi:putative ABC transport system permease protein